MELPKPKRRRLDAEADDAVFEVPSDTLAALHLLVGRAPSVLPVAAVLAHELYCVVNNRTEVDRSLHALQQSGAVVLVRKHCPDIGTGCPPPVGGGRDVIAVCAIAQMPVAGRAKVRFRGWLADQQARRR